MSTSILDWLHYKKGHVLFYFNSHPGNNTCHLFGNIAKLLRICHFYILT